jgi:hypothetical protein
MRDQLLDVVRQTKPYTIVVEVTWLVSSAWLKNTELARDLAFFLPIDISFIPKSGAW